MKSIKPGRGPSAMSGAASILAAVFGVFWTMIAVSMGAPGPFCLFGVVFILMAVGQAVYHFKNASSKERFSMYDIVDSTEEGDPAERFLAGERDTQPAAETEDGGTAAPEGSQEALKRSTGVRFCPYCGTEAEPEYRFCSNCGKELPK